MTVEDGLEAWRLGAANVRSRQANATSNVSFRLPETFASRKPSPRDQSSNETAKLGFHSYIIKNIGGRTPAM